jgi:hypothetical protein
METDLAPAWAKAMAAAFPMPVPLPLMTTLFPAAESSGLVGKMAG